MSRLIVKNLPKTITEDKLRELFSEKGTVTDIQLKYTPEGKFRQFAFIGYQKDDEADEAIKSLNKTFINTSKISVEKCTLLGDDAKPKAWSKYAADSSAFKKLHKQNDEVPEKKERKKNKKKEDETIELLKKYKDDPMFEEFLQVHAPKQIEKLRNLINKSNNEDSAIESKEISKDESEQSEDADEKEDKLADKPISDLEYMKQLMKGRNKETEIERKPRQKMEKKAKEKVQLFTLKLRDLPYSCKKKDIKQFFKPVKAFSIRIPRKIHGIAYVGFKNEKNFNKALLKDRSFINGKRISVSKYSGESIVDKEDANKNLDPKKSKWKSQEEALKNEEDIAESGRIFLRNLAYMTKEEDIENMFSKFGPIAEISLPVDQTTKKIKGFGVVTFLMPEHAVRAYSELDGSILHGRMLHLLPGKSKDEPTENLEDSSNYKKKKAAKQKSQAASSHNWNALFLGQDAVAEVIADTFRTSKEAVVGPDGKGSAAVRLALGETKIVAETRKYLEQQGVILDTFSAPTAKRSKTIILVKNLPARTEAREIRGIFEKHGEVGRVILPPSGITAVVEFLEPSEAKKAFARLAYSKFKNGPLYLEWAPENSLKSDKDTEETKKEESGVQEENVESENVIESEEKEDEDDEEPEDDTTLFVKNLNFQTTDEGLRKHFQDCGKIFYANVATKKDPSNPSSRLSMGYGFVRFYKQSSANKALKTLQQSVLDEKSLELKRSERTLDKEVKTAKKTSKRTKQTGSKILVRNVPFQANKKEIQELFSTFGEIKALRLPTKMDGSGSHRGFAFVDYTTPSAAKTAFEALSQSTHLYGRRLVLEWASQEEGVDEIRKRTAEHFREKEEVKSKKSVFSIDE